MPSTFQRRLTRACIISPLAISARHADISRISGLLIRGNSRRICRYILLPCRSHIDYYVDDRINYPVNYAFYTAKLNKFSHGLATKRVINRCLLLRTVDPHQVDRIIFVNVNRPLLGFSTIIGALGLLRRRINLDCQRLAIDAINLIPRVQRLTALGLPVRLTLSLRSPVSRVHSRLVPIGRH